MLKFDEKEYIQQLSIDCVLFGYKDRQLYVLIEKLRFKGNFWTLPGGFILNNENIDDAAQRILYTRTKIKNIFLNQFHVFGEADRSSTLFLKRLFKLNPEVAQKTPGKKFIGWITKRFISIGYYALVDIDQVSPQKNEIDTTIEWRHANDLPSLIMDHNKIVLKAIAALREDMDKKRSAFKLLPATFTMKDIQQVYETIFNKTFLRTNFQKKILEMNILTRLDKQYTGAANKAPYLYKLKNGFSMLLTMPIKKTTFAVK